MVAFVTEIDAVATLPKHVTVYDAAGAPLDSAGVSFTGQPIDGSLLIVADATGFSMTSSKAQVVFLVAHADAGQGPSLKITFAAATLKYSSP